jgi:tetratricopeptide (TPR) repeat protein
MMKHSPNTIGAQFAKGNMSAFNYFFNGKIDLAYTTSMELLESVEKSGDIYVQAMAYGSAGAACFGRALFDRAEQYLRVALTYAEKAALVSWQVWSAGFLGHTYVEMGANEKAVASYNQTIEMMRSSRLLPSWTNQIRIARERARVLMGDSRLPVDTLKEYYTDIKIKAAKGWAARHLGEILMQLDNPQAGSVDEWFEKAITENKDKNLAFFLACDYEAYARWCAHQGDFIQARQYMSQAKEQFSSCGADGWRKQAEDYLEQYETSGLE